MALSTWLCTKNTRNMFVKIVYPGGRVALYDRPILAAEVMQNNPRCWVAYPDVFRHPGAVVSPDTVLMLGQKFYVVPISTVKKLRRFSRRNSSSPYHDFPSPRLTPRHQLSSNTFDSKSPSLDHQSAPKRHFCCLRHSDEGFEASSSASTVSLIHIDRKERLAHDACFRSLLARIEPKQGEGTSAGLSCCMTSSGAEKINKKRANVGARRERKGFPWWGMKKAPPTRPVYNWQPSLERISEESLD